MGVANTCIDHRPGRSLRYPRAPLLGGEEMTLMGLAQHFDDRESVVCQLIRQKARHLALHPAFCGSERSDIEQELALEVIRNFERFDPVRASESTFIARIIESRAVSMLRTRLAEKRHFSRSGVSLNELVLDPDGGHVERAQTLESEAARWHTGREARPEFEQLDLKMDVDAVLATLPAELLRLAELLLHTSKLTAGAMLGRSRREVAVDLNRLREIFEDAHLHDYVCDCEQRPAPPRM